MASGAKMLKSKGYGGVLKKKKPAVRKGGKKAKRKSLAERMGQSAGDALLNMWK